MSAIKNSKFWAIIVLIASLLCVAFMAYALIGIRTESVTTRDASQYIRKAVQLGIVLIGCSALILIIGRKHRAVVVRCLVAIAILLVPLLTVKANMPAGTSIIAQPRPPAGSPPPPGRVTPINDVTTDTQNPPQFAAVIQQHTERTNSAVYPGAVLAKAQAEQFPDIKPITSNLSKQAAFARAAELADRNGWEIVAQDETSGMIEAVATTYFFRYKDDVVIRVTPSGAGSIVDIRSHSRIGRGDRGKNAERVRGFIKKF